MKKPRSLNHQWVPVFAMCAICLSYIILLPSERAISRWGSDSQPGRAILNPSFSGTNLSVFHSSGGERTTGKVQSIQIDSYGEVRANDATLSSNATLQTALSDIAKMAKSGLPTPKRTAWTDPGTVPIQMEQKSVSDRVATIKDFSIRAKDVKIRAKSLIIDRGTIGFFRTALFREVNVDNASMEFSEGPIRKVNFEKGKIRFPVGNAHMSNGWIQQEGKHAKRFRSLVISSRSGMVLDSKWHDKTDSRRTTEKSILGLRSPFGELVVTEREKKRGGG